MSAALRPAPLAPALRSAPAPLTVPALRPAFATPAPARRLPAPGPRA